MRKPEIMVLGAAPAHSDYRALIGVYPPAAPQPRSYEATLTYKDGTGATIGTPVLLSATSSCIVVG